MTMNPNEVELIQLLDKQIFPYVFPLFFVGIAVGILYIRLCFQRAENEKAMSSIKLNSLPVVMIVCFLAGSYGKWDDYTYSAQKLRMDIGTITEKHPGLFEQSSTNFVINAYAKCYESGNSDGLFGNACSKSHFYNTFLPRMNAPVVVKESHSAWWFVGGVVVGSLLFGKSKRH